jgi:2,3-bisphosphoglycerate-independent phosphoglycerate mutase
MAEFGLMRTLHRDADTRVVLLILDGLGGLPREPGGPTELEAAATPNLDRLAAEGSLGLIVPVRRGISPGSGPAHLALFGYDPLAYDIGRGVLEAAGVGVHVEDGDVAARGNFCTIDDQGRISDRRAGRIATDLASPLTERLAAVEVPGVRVEVRHVREHRFVVVMRGNGLAADLEDTDPLEEGYPPLPVRALTPEAARTAELFNRWIEQARAALADQPQANALTLRGFSTDPGLPQVSEIYGLNAACVAVYPMYQGVAKLVGMVTIDFRGERPEDEFEAVGRSWNEHDFFFVHVKKTDSRGEDGDFEGKARAVEEVDRALPRLLDLKPDVLAVTGDHSTPSSMRTHTWHPVPFLLWAPGSSRSSGRPGFGERACQNGDLGTFPATEVMPLLMAHAGRLERYGA